MLRLRQYFLQTNAYRTISNTFGYVASPFEEDDLRNDQSVNSKEKKWKKQIQQDISNFQPDGIEYPTSSILQQLGTVLPTVSPVYFCDFQDSYQLLR